MGLLRRMWQAFYDNAYLLLVATTLLWAGNTIASRLAVGHVSPMALTSLRWFIVLAVLLPLSGRRMAQDWPKLRPFTVKIVWMAFCGFTGFNALFYAAAYSTGAANLAIFQGMIPVFVMLGAWLLFKTPVTAMQWIGFVIAFAGVVVVGLKGNLTSLNAQGFSSGDLLMLSATLLSAAYTLGLRQRPAVSGLVFFTALALAASLTSLPLIAGEIALGRFQMPTLTGWLIMAYIALLPSLIAQLFYIRGVELIGPSRAGLFVNLVPVFGTTLAAMLPNEPFAVYHVIGLALVIGGIILAERK